MLKDVDAEGCRNSRASKFKGVEIRLIKYQFGKLDRLTMTKLFERPLTNCLTRKLTEICNGDNYPASLFVLR